jgi:hypothetical protein
MRRFRVEVPSRICDGTRNLLAGALFPFQQSPLQENNMKLATIAVFAALTATPVLADTIEREQARADLHQAKADAARSQEQKEDAQATASVAQSDAAGAQVQANAAQSDASTLQAQANAAQSQADAAKSQASTSQSVAENARASAAAAAANRDAALDRAADARATVHDN